MADYGVRITLSADSPVPSYNVAPWVSGVASLSSGAVNAGWTSGRLISVSSIGEQVDIASGGNYAEVSEFRAVIDANGYPAFLAAGASLLGAVVEVGTLASGTLSERFRGVVSDLSWEGQELSIQVESITTMRHKSIPSRIITAQEFPGVATDSEGQPVPIVYGAVERMAPPTISSTPNQLNALAISDGTTTRSVATTWIPVYAGVPVVTSTTIPVAYAICPAGGTMPAGDVIGKIISGENVFIEIAGGTGAGQRRRIISGYFLPSRISPGNGYDIAAFVADVAPWDTTPDSTSTLKCISDDSVVSLAIADEATVSSVTAEVDGTEYAIGHSIATSSGIVFADVSSEFRNGEDYAAIEYREPDNDYGVPELSDLVTATTARTVKGLSSGIMVSGMHGRVFDAFCRGKIGYASIPAAAIDKLADLYIVASLDASALPSDSDLAGPMSVYPQIIVRAFNGATYTPQMWSSDGETPGASSIPFVSFNAFPPAVAPDGTAGAFSAYAWKMPDIGIPLSEVESIEYALGISARPRGAVGNAINQVYAAVTGGSDDLTVTFGTVPSIGDWIRPRLDGDGLFYAQYFANIGYQSGYWRAVTGVSGSTITVSDASDWDAGHYRFLVANPLDLGDVLEREIGIAFVYGSIPPTTPFRASVSAGRTYGAHWPALPAGKSNGDAITQPRDMALDILYRDLGLVAAQVDFAAFQALPDGTVSAVLSEQEDSRDVLARLAREWNWILGHDASGRETATAWLEPVYSMSADYSIANADIVSGTLVGIDQTALEDVVTLPSLSWDRTQADGFRQAGAVVDVTADPSAITPSNYLQTITGFRDFSTALDAYIVLHVAWERSIILRSGEYTYTTGGTPFDLYYGRLMEWAASRKDVLDLRINEGHAAAAAHVGQRVSVTHRRYTGGGTVYGTVAGRWWHPEDGQAQLVVMLDNATFDVTSLYIDTLDPGVEQYIDKLDGTSPQYIDTPGGT